MKVFIIIHTTTPGGVQRIGAYEASFLRRLNYETTLLSIVKPRSGEWSLFQKLRVKPIYLTRNELLGRMFYTLMLGKAPISVNGIKPDIIIAHNIPGGQASLSLRKFYGNDIPMLLYLHDPIVYPISGSFYAMITSRFPSTLLYIEKKLIQESSIILVNSKRALVKLTKIHRIKELLEPKDKVNILYPTMNIPIPEHKIKKEKYHYLLIVGRIDHEAFFNLYKIMRKINIPLVIAGSYHPYNINSRKIIQMFLSLREKGKKIKFVLNPSDSKLLELYRSASLFVYPGHENFNMSALEAMSAGCPILVANSSGICEILPEGLREYLCLSKNNIDLWIARILEIMKNSRSYHLGRKLWRITQKYNIYTHMDRLAKILKELER